MQIRASVMMKTNDKIGKIDNQEQLTLCKDRITQPMQFIKITFCPPAAVWDLIKIEKGEQTNKK